MEVVIGYFVIAVVIWVALMWALTYVAPYRSRPTIYEVTSVTVTSAQYGVQLPDGTWEIQEVLPDAIR